MNVEKQDRIKECFKVDRRLKKSQLSVHVQFVRFVGVFNGGEITKYKHFNLRSFSYRTFNKNHSRLGTIHLTRRFPGGYGFLFFGGVMVFCQQNSVPGRVEKNTLKVHVFKTNIVFIEQKSCTDLMINIAN